MVAIVATLLVATLGATRWTSDMVHDTQMDRLAYESGQTDIALEQRMQAYVQVLRGGVGLFAGSDDVSLQEWVNYVDTLELNERYPGFKSLSWAPAVPDAELASFVREVRNGPVPPDIDDPTLITGYTPRSPTGVPGETDLHSPILYVAPFVSENQIVIGVDMMQDPTRREVMLRAAETGGAVLSPRLTLAGQADQRAGFIAYMPVHRGGELQGWLTAAFRAPDLMDGLRGEIPQTIDFAIEDGAGGLLYSTEGLGPNGTPEPLTTTSGLTRTSTVQMPGRTWDVRYVANDAFVPSTERISPWLVTVSGMLIIWLVIALSVTGAGWRSLAAQIDHQRGEVVVSAAEARHQATHDRLTGIGNRSLFDQTIAQWLTGGPFVLAYIDVDDFKPVNDVLGHRAGDALLRAIAERMVGNVAETDLVARLGGDEFVVLFRGRAGSPDPDPAQPFGPAERLTRTLAAPYRIALESETREVRITVSMGTACFPADGTTPDALLHAADLAMFAAKSAGGDGSRPARTRPVDAVAAEVDTSRDFDPGTQPGGPALF